MIDGKIEFTIDPIAQADRLKKGMRNTAIRKSMNKAAAVVKAAVVGKAPQRFGYLAKAQRIKVRQYKTGAVWVAVVGAKSDFKRNKGKYKRGPNKGQPRVHRPSKYAKLVEKGTKRSKARPYLKPALDATSSAYLHTLRASIAEQVEQLLRSKN